MNEEQKEYSQNYLKFLDNERKKYNEDSEEYRNAENEFLQELYDFEYIIQNEN